MTSLELRVVPVVINPRALTALPASLRASRDDATGAFPSRDLRADESEWSACAELLEWMRAQPAPQSGARAACGVNDPSAVRGYWLEAQPLWDARDVLSAELIYDEEVVPLHAHVVVRLATKALDRWRAWSAANPRGALAVMLGEQVNGTGVRAVDSDHAWITLAVTRSDGLESNASVSQSLVAHLESLAHAR